MPAYSQSTIQSRSPPRTKFAASRSLWHGPSGVGARGAPRSGRPSLLRRRVRRRERDARGAARRAYASTTRKESNRPGDRRGPRGSRRSSAAASATSKPPDLALDEARHEVALRLDERDDLRADPERRRARAKLRARRARSIPSSLGVLAADRSDERLAAGDDLEVVVRDPAAERLDRLDAARPDALTTRRSCRGCARRRGSKSGSARPRLRPTRRRSRPRPAARARACSAGR